MSQPESGKDRKIMIIPKKCMENDTSFEIITLKHPFTGEGAKYLLPQSREKVYEIIVQKDKFSSWFVGSTVREDGALHICSEFDPLYLILPYLEDATEKGKFMLLDQICKDSEFPDCAKLVECCQKLDLTVIADVNGSGDYVAYKYNEKKALNWLSQKVCNIREAIKKSGIFIAATDDDDKENEDIHLEYAFGILSNYIPENLSSLLQSHLNLRKKATKRRSVDSCIQPNSKKMKKDKKENQKTKKGPKMTKAQRDLSKVDKKGMKSISSFFSTKPKK